MSEQSLILPSDFTIRMQDMLMDEWDSFLKSYSENNFHAFRINKLKKGMNDHQIAHIFEVLHMQNPKPVLWANDGYYYEDSCHPGKHPYHEMGLYYIQEPSAMSAAALLAPNPGERVLDLCAAPGGKSTQLASYMDQKGILFSNEINNARCKILAQNVERLGLANVVVTNEDSNDLANHLPEFFHKILVDAPCSGEGMFRKNNEAIKEWSLDNVNICAERQLMILDNAARMLMNHGLLVYSTCTFAPNENEEAIYRFLVNHPEFVLVHKEVPQFDSANPMWIRDEFLDRQVDKDILKDSFRLWPHHLDGEGHYAAILFKGNKNDYKEYLIQQRETSSKNLSTTASNSLILNEETFNNSITSKKKKKDKNNSNKSKNSSWGDKSSLSLLEEFLDTSLSTEMKDYIIKGNLTLFGDQLYLLPDQVPNLNGIKVLRAGLHIGTFKKNRFEPSHALALFLGKDDVNLTYNLDISDSRVEAYFRGESIQVEEKNGWCLLLVDGMSAGWGKIGNNIMKNHYPKGLRINSF